MLRTRRLSKVLHDQITGKCMVYATERQVFVVSQFALTPNVTVMENNLGSDFQNEI